MQLVQTDYYMNTYLGPQDYPYRLLVTNLAQPNSTATYASSRFSIIDDLNQIGFDLLDGVACSY